MAKHVLSAPQFQNEEAAFAYVEARLWPNGPVCHHCGERERIGKLAGKSTRPGLYKCYRCRKPFTVRMGTIFESSHLPLHLWLQVIHLICASKKGIASRQIQRMLQCSMKTAWFLTHRIREAMNENPGVFYSPLGGDGGTIEADETYVGGKAENRAYGVPKPKQVVMTLVERGGAVRSFHIPNVTANTLRSIIGKHAHRDSRFMTDEANAYTEIGWIFLRTGPSNTASRNMCAEKSTPTPSKATSRFCSGASSAFTTMSRKQLEAISQRVRFPLYPPDRARR